MKTRLTLVLTALCTALSLRPLGADETKKERIEVTVLIPETTETLWSQIDEDTWALAQLVAEGKKDEAYAMSENSRSARQHRPRKVPRPCCR